VASFRVKARLFDSEKDYHYSFVVTIIPIPKAGSALTVGSIFRQIRAWDVRRQLQREECIKFEFLAEPVALMGVDKRFNAFNAKISKTGCP
jgi:hypothetical protein